MITDISLRGAFIEAGASLPKGKAFLLRLDLDKAPESEQAILEKFYWLDRNFVAVRVVIRWVTDTGFGVEFVNPFYDPVSNKP